MKQGLTNLSNNQRIEAIKHHYSKFNVQEGYDKTLFSKTFISACIDGNIEVVNHLLSLTSKEFQEEMIYSHGNFAFIAACVCGNKEIVQLLLDLTPDQTKREEMIHAHDNRGFIGACASGNKEIVQLLLDITPDQTKREVMIHAQEDLMFIEAVRYNHIEIVELLLESTPDQNKKEEMIQAWGNQVFLANAQSGNAKIFDLILEHVSDNKRDEILSHAKTDLVLTTAANHGYTKLLNKLLELIPEPKRSETINNYKLEPYMDMEKHFRIAQELANLKLVCKDVQQRLETQLQNRNNIPCELTRFILSFATDAANVDHMNRVSDIMSKVTEQAKFCIFPKSQIKSHNRGSFVRQMIEQKLDSDTQHLGF
ncbi:ankyrin repeat-containing protein [endosymbiont of Acanthamoeba sp. UWC8]|uniref:ankyrin repeat domain-containing protein n=1 Tax=endosymbiont of Acanthamoeba sp. UWC8 TaxID=86106 RepID=UPI0004D0E8D4|nr:ankyrin repeat domain-containing protein [endosymbiont of Acanthamoeba sp. UWC8]AIF81796.1 ankyrin repeat-containing protein [endosymbiont of Acanthamoeba sp. UWC8]